MSSSIVLQLTAMSSSMVFLLTLLSSPIVPLLLLSGLLEQLLRVPRVPKSSHLGQRIYLHSGLKLEVKLALKSWPLLGSIFSGDSVTVITSALINEKIEPRSGMFFIAIWKKNHYEFN